MRIRIETLKCLSDALDEIQMQLEFEGKPAMVRYSDSISELKTQIDNEINSDRREALAESRELEKNKRYHWAMNHMSHEDMMKSRTPAGDYYRRGFHDPTKKVSKLDIAYGYWKAGMKRRNQWDDEKQSILDEEENNG